MKVLLLKLISGEEILCQVDEDIPDDAKRTVLNNVRKVMHVPTPNGMAAIIVNFWAGSPKDDKLDIRVAHILAGSVPPFELEATYREGVSGIALPFGKG